MFNYICTAVLFLHARTRHGIVRRRILFPEYQLLGMVEQRKRIQTICMPWTVNISNLTTSDIVSNKIS